MAKSLIRLGAIVALLTTGFVPGIGGAAPAEDQPADSPEPEVSASVRNDTSPPLMEMAEQADAAEPSREDFGPGQREAPEPGTSGTPSRPSVSDPSTQAPAPAPTLTFDGVGNADNLALAGVSLAPPDTEGDVGPNHYVQWNNVTFRIFNKSGVPLIPATPGNALFAGFGGPCQTTNDGDPIALYDPLADRWFLSQFALPNFPSGPFSQCIAVSTTADPTGTYHRYEFVYSATEMNDYPKFGVWPDGYYMSVNEFLMPAGTFDGVGVVAYERSKMLQGLPALQIKFDLSGTFPLAFAFLPADLDGPTPPPQGSPNYFTELADPLFGYPGPAINVYRFHADFANPGSSTFTGPDANPIAAFDSNMCNFARNCIPQPGTTVGLDAISGQVMYRNAYRNFGSREVMVGNATIDVTGTNQAGIRWFELRSTTTPANWGVFQEATHSPDSHNRWMGSIAMDDGGNIALGYSVSSATVSPSIRYAGRAPTDPLGTLGFTEQTMTSGGGSQTGPHPGENRWGDYSMMAVDPSDGCTFWYTQEYYSASSAISWQTRVGTFQLPGCQQITPSCSVPGTVGNDVLLGTSGDDEMCGFGGDDELRGFGGNDELKGGSGEDILRGGGGRDFMKGGADADLLVGNAGNDDLRGGGGNDIQRGSAGNDDLYGNAGNDRLVGNNGDDFLSGGGGTDRCRDGDPGTTFRACER